MVALTWIIVKSFTSLTEAEAFIANTTTAASPTTSSSATPIKYYAVRSGRIPGVYTNWPDAQAQITGWMKPKHKSFATKAEAEAFVRASSVDNQAVTGVAATAAQPDKPAEYDKRPPTKKEVTKPAAKKQKGNSGAAVITHDGVIEAGNADLPPGAEDDFDPRIIMDPNTGRIEWKDHKLMQATKIMPKAVAPGTMINIYTDGSSLANGQTGATAGVGVYFGPGDPK